MNKQRSYFTPEAPVGSLWKVKPEFHGSLVYWLDLDELHVQPGKHYFYLEDIDKVDCTFMSLGKINCDSQPHEIYYQFLVGEKVVWIEQSDCVLLVPAKSAF